MQTASAEINFYDYHPKLADIANEVIDGLNQSPRVLSPKFFYDEKGSQLFDKICQTEEYYPTATETQIIRDNINEIAECIGDGCLLVEPGSGNSRKVRELFDALQPHAYLPMDISRAYLRKEANKLAQEFPWLNVHAICTDFTSPVDLPYKPKGPHRVAFFPGSSIGNFHPQEAVEFLSNIANMVGINGSLLIGVDLKKSHTILNAAYNDKLGYTEAFNKNLLNRINRDIDANFDTELFDHLAYYNESKGRIEMHLVSQVEHSVTVEGEEFQFAEGESIHTENSYKYSVDEFQDLAACAGFNAVKVWTDNDNLFSLHYFDVR